MALSALRLRRPLSLASAALGRAIAAAPTTAPRCSPNFSCPVFSPTELGRVPAPLWTVPSASFRSTAAAALPSSPRYGDDDKISPDTILFEGCDYNHWLITMDFPKDPSPTREEKIKAYEDTCAMALGCSLEEAKKKIYACSTTTYTGFQVVVTEEESEKFRGLPGVVFILPDSYIDPVNKEYGGDKYIDGTIIPRPPPTYQKRPARDRPRRDYSAQQNFNSNENQYSSSRDGRGFAPQQNYGPPGQNDGRGFVPPAQMDSRFGPSGQNGGSGHVQSGQSDGKSYAQTGFNDGRGMGPPGQWNAPTGHSMPAEGGYGQGERRGPMPPPGYQGGEWRGSPPQDPPSYNQTERGNFNPQGPPAFGGNNRAIHPQDPPSYNQTERGNFNPQGPSAFSGNNRGIPTQDPTSYNQTERGNFNPQGPPAFSGNNRGMNSSPSGDYRQGGPGYNQNYAAPVQDQRFDRDFQQNGPSGHGQNYGRPSGPPQFNEQ